MPSSIEFPFNKPFIPRTTYRSLKRTLEQNELAGDGRVGRQVENQLSDLFGGARVILTPSCTSALEFSLQLLDIGSGDEVIVSSYNFSSAITSILLVGAKPVVVDNDINTKSIDLQQIESKITPRTKAISVLNYNGHTPNVLELKKLATTYRLKIIEDNAHGFMGYSDGYKLGNIGDLVTLSFHETKNLQCGEGGALIVNDSTLTERAEIMRDKGTNRKLFIKGEVDKYSMIEKGGSYYLPES